MKREPVLSAGAIVGAILSIATALIAFGVIDWTEAQLGALEAALLAVVPLLITLAAHTWPGARSRRWLILVTTTGSL